jgi:hypothetical protein
MAPDGFAVVRARLERERAAGHCFDEAWATALAELELGLKRRAQHDEPAATLRALRATEPAWRAAFDRTAPAPAWSAWQPTPDPGADLIERARVLS